jgi:enoyl-CoA hydratase/carnithine racemase
MTANAIQSVHPVLLEHLDGHVARITLNRPNARNAVNGDLANSLERAIRDTETDSEVRVVVLTGAGRGFCAGADFAEVAAGREAALWTESGGFAGFVKSIRRKPWLAAVHGFAFAGGLEIALSCDLIVASEDARFGLPEVKRGLVAAAGGLYRLPRAVPRNLAAEIVLTGEPFPASRAWEMGLVNQLVPASGLQDAALALARRIAGNAPLAVAESLRILRLASDLTETELQTISDEGLAHMAGTEDIREGARAFLEKRDPLWVGR